MDANGYPEQAELDTIKAWPLPDWQGLMKYVGERWHWPDHWRTRLESHQQVHAVSTGGWSGNEGLIRALEANVMFWAICWFSSQRGGHYVFKIPLQSSEPAEQR